MSKSNAFENALLKLIFNNDDTVAPVSDMGDAGGLVKSTADGSFYLSLHTANPDETGGMTTSETAYTGYSRVAVARTTGGWTVTDNSVSPAADVDFGECTASPGSPLTHFAIGNASAGAGAVVYYGTLTPNITMATGVIPRIKSTSTITED